MGKRTRSRFGKSARLFLRFPQVSHEAHKFCTAPALTAIARLIAFRQSALHRECRYLHAKCGPQRTLGAMRANGSNAEATLRCGGVSRHAGAGGQQAKPLEASYCCRRWVRWQLVGFLDTGKALCGLLPPLGHLRRDGARSVLNGMTGPGRRLAGRWLEPCNSLIRWSVG